MDFSNPTITDMLPLLFGKGGEGNTRQMRTAFVQHGVQSTIVLPGDWPVSQRAWFTDFKYPPRDNNSVKYLIDGIDTYKAMTAAIATATSSDHFILLLGWSLDLDFSLDGGTGKALKDILKVAYDAGVWIRILRWKVSSSLMQPYYASMQQSIKSFADTFTGRAPEQAMMYVDGDTRLMGSHHQKILIVSGSEGLIGFFGGIDFFKDRVSVVEPGDPQHDVHSMTTGDAAKDLYDIVKDRFNACTAKYRTVFTDPSNDGNPSMGVEPTPVEVLMQVDPAVDGMSAPDSFAKLPAPVDGKPVAPMVSLKFAQTIGNPKITAPSDLLPQVKLAVGAAKRLIYCQDQYLWSLDMAGALNAAMKKNEKLQLIILLPTPERAAAPWLQRAALNTLIDGLSATALNNVSVCRPKTPGAGFGLPGQTPGCYVHSKIWVFDDELAIVGSANCNNRGYTNDSEVIGAYADPDWTAAKKWYELELNLAHKLRIDLWAKHLVMPREALHDPATAALYWRYPRAEGGIEALKPIKDGQYWWVKDTSAKATGLTPFTRWLVDPESDGNQPVVSVPAPMPTALPPNPPAPSAPAPPPP